MEKHKTSPAAPAKSLGDVALILHGHAPFVRQPGRDAAGEEALHGLIANSYAPLLAGLYDLVDAGVRVRLGLALSPLLLEQLADPVVQKHTLQSLEAAVARADERVQEHKSQHDEHGAYVAQFYSQLHRRTLHIFERKFGRNLVAATRMLAESGVVEILAHTATHVVPAMHDRTSLRVQLEAGLISILRHLGQRPSILWAADDPLSAELVDLLPPLGLRGVIGPADPMAPVAASHWINERKTVWALTPDPRLPLHVRSASLGYPSDMLYRAAASGPLSDTMQTTSGAAYDPYHAYARTRLHAQHFIAVLEDLRRRQPSHLVFACPMEVFGSGWFEGGLWLRTLIEQLHRAPTLKLCRPSTVAAQYPPTYRVELPPLADQADPELAAAAARMRALVAAYPRAYGDREEVLNQAARELTLAQGGDWDRWGGSAYAAHQRATHLANFHHLCELSVHEVLLPVAAREFAELKERDNPFPALNYRLFGTQEDTE
jgi:1,4-alpha-glucan branching enzyme